MNKHLEYNKPQLTIYDVSVEDIMLISGPGDQLLPEDNLFSSDSDQ